MGQSSSRTITQRRGVRRALADTVPRLVDDDRCTSDTCGTCSMMPRDRGGVVDHTLKVKSLPDVTRCLLIRLCQVYGTNNIRVVDLSVVPLHFASHTQGMHSFAFYRTDIRLFITLYHSDRIRHCRERYFCRFRLLRCANPGRVAADIIRGKV